MRRNVLKKGQDICFFCALRLGYDTTPAFLRPPPRYVRTYKTDVRLRRPAGAAVALRRDDEDEEEDQIRVRRLGGFETDRSQPRQQQRQQAVFDTVKDQQDWKCRCGHHNAARRTECTVCLAPKPRDIGYGQLAQTLSGSGVRGRRDGDMRNPSRTRDDAFDRNLQRSRVQSAPVSQSEPRRQQPSNGRSRFGSFMDNLDPNPPRQAGNSSNRPPTVSGFDAFSQAVRGTSRMNQDGQSQRRPNIPQASSSERNRSGQTALSESDLVVPMPEAQNLEDESVLEHRRRHDRGALSSKARRRQRFDLDDVDSTTTGTSANQQQKQPKGANSTRRRRSATEIELEALEDEYYEVSDGRSARRGQQQVEPVRPRLEISEYMSVERLAQVLKIKAEDLLERLEEEGFEGARYDHILDAETSGMFADLYGYEPIQPTFEEPDLVARLPAEDASLLPSRPPIVTIMGHVDHGKTTILDYLRKSSVVAGEHGGITQHIGAFSVIMPRTQRKITFLDTPGHAAFLDMRRRGAVVTDIVVLVVAADDSVKPQTIEAIKHALDAKVQIIVAINKIDKEDADTEKVKTDLARHNIAVEDYGGEYQAIALSGKTGQGMGDLEEAIITLADVSDFRAETDGQAEGWIIESKVTSAGRVATVLVRRGTLRRGDFIVAGGTWARVRTLRNDAGELVTEAPPGTPVQIDGWRGEDPTAGLEVLQAEDEAHAKRVVALREKKTEGLRTATDMIEINKSKSDEADARAKVLEWRAEKGLVGRSGGRKARRQNNEGWVESSDITGPKKVHFVVKADVAGSVEAIVAAVNAIGNNEVQANVIHSGTGMLSESDIRMLATTGEVGYAITFNQAVDGTMYRLAEAAELEIMDHNIIYKVTDLVKEKVEAELPPLISHRVLGEAEIGKIFDINVKRKKLKVAGCRITNGTVSKSQQVRVLRNNEVVYSGTLHSLKNVKKDVTEMRKDSECGMAFEDWEDFREGDNVQSFEEIREKRKLY